MSIQGAVNNLFGGTERAIGVYKYFVDNGMKSDAVTSYVQDLKQEGTDAIEKARATSLAAVEAEEKSKNYRGKNYQKGQEMQTKALYDADKAVEASYEVAKNIRGIMEQKNGSLFARSRFLGRVNQAQRDRAVATEQAMSDVVTKIKDELHNDKGVK